MNPIKVDIQRGSDGVVNVVKVSKAGRSCIVTYDSTRSFTVTGSLPRHFADVLAIQAAYSPTAIDIVAQTVGNVSMDIAAQSVGNIAVDLAAQSVGNIEVDIVAQTVGNLDVNIAAQAANIDINIAAQAADIDVNVTNATIAITGNVNATVTGSVTVTSGAVTVSTAGGVNLLIDKITQSAYTERSSTLSNDGTVASYVADTGNDRRGKFFPRGCRGHLQKISVYCKDNGAAGGTISVYIAPQIGMGYTYTADATVAAGGAAAWRDATFNVMWNYDSMFIWFVSSTADMQVGRDTTATTDAYYSSDAGVSWAQSSYRYYFRAVLYGETVGDVPVSGTINNIPIPNLCSARQSVSLAVPNEGSLYDTAQVGAGKVLWVIFHIEVNSASDLVPRIRCDGTQVLPSSASMQQWYDANVTATTPGICIGQWDTTNHYYNLIVKIPFPFRRTLEVGYENNHAAPGSINTYVGYVYELIS